MFDAVRAGPCWRAEGLVESTGRECCWGSREREGTSGISEVAVPPNGGLRSVRREDKRERMDTRVIVERVQPHGGKDRSGRLESVGSHPVLPGSLLC